MNAKPKRSLTILALIAIVGLLVLNAVLLINKYKQDKVINEQATLIEQITTLQADLDRELSEARSELETMRGDNERMNQLIDEQTAELDKQKQRIFALLKDSKSLAVARDEMKKLRGMVDGYIAQLHELEQKNMQLADTAIALREDRLLLVKRIAEERRVNDDLLADKSDLESEREALIKNNRKLAKKVDRASMVEVDKVEVSGYKLGDKGEERTRRKAKNINGLKVCFHQRPNALVEEEAEETFHLRIIDPYGETLAIEQLGSGVLTEQDGTTDIRYTREVSTTHNDGTHATCANWMPELPFKSGDYLVEIYNKGYLSGVGLTTLK